MASGNTEHYVSAKLMTSNSYQSFKRSPGNFRLRDAMKVKARLLLWNMNHKGSKWEIHRWVENEKSYQQALGEKVRLECFAWTSGTHLLSNKSHVSPVLPQGRSTAGIPTTWLHWEDAINRSSYLHHTNRNVTMAWLSLSTFAKVDLWNYGRKLFLSWLCSNSHIQRSLHQNCWKQYRSTEMEKKQNKTKT